MEHNEYVALEQQLQTHFDERYVLQNDCNQRQKVLTDEQNKMETQIQLMLQKWNIIEKLLWAVVTTTVGILVSSIINLIIK